MGPLMGAGWARSWQGGQGLALRNLLEGLQSTGRLARQAAALPELDWVEPELAPPGLALPPLPEAAQAEPGEPGVRVRPAGAPGLGVQGHQPPPVAPALQRERGIPPAPPGRAGGPGPGLSAQPTGSIALPSDSPAVGRRQPLVPGHDPEHPSPARLGESPGLVRSFRPGNGASLGGAAQPEQGMALLADLVHRWERAGISFVHPSGRPAQGGGSSRADQRSTPGRPDQEGIPGQSAQGGIPGQPPGRPARGGILGQPSGRPAQGGAPSQLARGGIAGWPASSETPARPYRGESAGWPTPGEGPGWGETPDWLARGSHPEQHASSSTPDWFSPGELPASLPADVPVGHPEGPPPSEAGLPAGVAPTTPSAAMPQQHLHLAVQLALPPRSAAAGGDLDDLAGRIKQILMAEARRHGIDFS